MCRKEFGVMMDDCRLGVRVKFGLGDMNFLVGEGEEVDDWHNIAQLLVVRLQCFNTASWL